MTRNKLACWLAAVLGLSLGGCNGPDWEQICDEFKAIASECSSNTQSAACNPDAYEECGNEEDIAAKFEQCNAIGASDCPGWASCFLPDGLPECVE